MANIIFSEASGVNDSIFGKSQVPIRMFIQKRGEEFEQNSMVKKLFKIEKSTHFGEKFTSLTAMNGFEVAGENGAYPTDGMEEGYSKVLESVEWKDSFAISQKIIEDSQMMDLQARPEKFITAYYRTQERFGAALLGNAIQGNSSVKFAKKVMIQLSGIRYKGRQVRCNDADEGGKAIESKKPSKPKRQKKDNWRELMNKAPRDLKGKEPDFSEEGWAMRKPRKKKK